MQEVTPATQIIGEIMSPVLGVPADEVDPSTLGLGGLGIIQAMTLAQFADAIAVEGGEVTGKSLYDYFDAFPAICTFEFPVIEYTEDGTLQPAEGIEVVSAFDYLP